VRIRTDSLIPEWTKRAACADADVARFFPDSGSRRRKSLGSSELAAKQACFSCPVRLECLVFALSSDRQPLMPGMVLFKDIFME
jgi:hypothetical protein